MEHGFLEIDTKPPDRATRPIALGRKNHLFVGPSAGDRAAVISYTQIEAAKLNDTDPQPWRADDLEQHHRRRPRIYHRVARDSFTQTSR